MASTSQVTALVGGIPTVSLDVPILGVFIGLFLIMAVSHMTIFITNKKRGHKFIFSGLCFGFCMSRIVACIFRLVWATQPTNGDISLVASIFVNAGILLIYILNVHLAWRMVRAAAPEFGWNPTVRLINKITLWFILPLFIPLIVTLVLRIKQPTLAGVSTASTVLGRLAQTYFLIIAVEPALLLVYAVVAAGAARRRQIKINFARGSWNAKVVILAISITGAILEAGFRCGTAWAPAPLATDPAWWDSKPAFYCFNFVIDIFILLNFLVGRFDRRFHIPNGANGPYSYQTTNDGVY